MTLFPVQPPSTSLFSTAKTGTGVTLATNDGSNAFHIRRSDAVASAVERIGFRGKAVPAGSSWEAVMGLWTTPFGRASNRYYRQGLCILENATGKNLHIAYSTENQAPRFHITYMSNLDTWGSTPWTSSGIFGGRFPVLFKVAYDGTNYVFYYSLDFGGSWVTAATLAKASYFTADLIGVCVQNFNTQDADMNRAEVFYYDDPDFP